MDLDGAPITSPSCRRIWSNDGFVDRAEPAPGACDGAPSDAGSSSADDDGRFVWDGGALRVEDGRRHFRAVRRRGPYGGGGRDGAVGADGHGRWPVAAGDGPDCALEARCPPRCRRPQTRRAELRQAASNARHRGGAPRPRFGAESRSPRARAPGRPPARSEETDRAARRPETRPHPVRLASPLRRSV